MLGKVPPKSVLFGFGKGARKSCDCNHSTVASADDSLAVAFPQCSKRSRFLGSFVIRLQTLSLGGLVTVQYWVYFFLGVSVFSLIVALFFARQVIGSGVGTPEMQKIAAAIKEGAVAFLKRQYKTVAALLGLLLPTFAYAQTEHAGGGGEANLTLPDLSSVNFFGMNGHALLMIGIAVLRRRPVVRPDDLCAVEEPAGSSHDARNVRTDL